MRAEGPIKCGCLTEGKAAVLPADAREQRTVEYEINTLAHQEMLMWARWGIVSYGQTICAKQISLVKTWYKSGHISQRSALHPQSVVQGWEMQAQRTELAPNAKNQ